MIMKIYKRNASQLILVALFISCQPANIDKSKLYGRLHLSDEGVSNITGDIYSDILLDGNEMYLRLREKSGRSILDTQGNKVLSTSSNEVSEK